MDDKGKISVVTALDLHENQSNVILNGGIDRNIDMEVQNKLSTRTKISMLLAEVIGTAILMLIGCMGCVDYFHDSGELTNENC
jgi:hypothetical protein